MNSSRSSSRGRIQLTYDQSADNYQASAMALQKKAQLSRVSSKKSIIEIARSQNSSCSSMKRIDSFPSQPFSPQQFYASPPNTFTVPKVSRNAKTISNTMLTFEQLPKQKLQFSFAQNIRNTSSPYSLQVFKNSQPPPQMQTIKPLNNINSIRTAPIVVQTKQPLARSQHKYTPMQSIIQPFTINNLVKKQAMTVNSPNQPPKRPQSARPTQYTINMPISNTSNIKHVQLISPIKNCLQASFNPVITKQVLFTQPNIKRQSILKPQTIMQNRTSAIQSNIPVYYRQDDPIQKQAASKLKPVNPIMPFHSNQLQPRTSIPQGNPGQKDHIIIYSQAETRPIQPNHPRPNQVGMNMNMNNVKQCREQVQSFAYQDRSFLKQNQSDSKLNTIQLYPNAVQKLQQSHLYPSPMKPESLKQAPPLKREIQEWKPLTEQDYISYGLKQQSVQLRKSEQNSMVPVHNESLFRVDHTPVELLGKFNDRQKVQFERQEQSTQHQKLKPGKLGKISNIELDRYMAPKFGEPYEEKYFELALSKEDSKDTTRASNFKQQWSPYEHISGIVGKIGKQRQLKKQTKSKATRPLFKESVNMRSVEAVESIMLESKQPRQTDSKRRVALGDYEMVQFKCPIYSGMY